MIDNNILRVQVEPRDRRDNNRLRVQVEPRDRRENNILWVQGRVYQKQIEMKRRSKQREENIRIEFVD